MTSLERRTASIVSSTAYSGFQQRKYQSPALLDVAERKPEAKGWFSLHRQELREVVIRNTMRSRGTLTGFALWAQWYLYPRNEVRWGILDSPCLSVRLSVCPSVRLPVCPSVRLSVNLSCPPCSIYSSGWILSKFGTNDQLHERVCRMWWPLTLTYIFKAIRPWLWKSCPLCNVFSSRSIISIFATNNHYH